MTEWTRSCMRGGGGSTRTTEEEFKKKSTSACGMNPPFHTWVGSFHQLHMKNKKNLPQRLEWTHGPYLSGFIPLPQRLTSAVEWTLVSLSASLHSTFPPKNLVGDPSYPFQIIQVMYIRFYVKMCNLFVGNFLEVWWNYFFHNVALQVTKGIRVQKPFSDRNYVHCLWHMYIA